MSWIFSLLASGVADFAWPFLTSAAGLAVPGLGIAGMVGGALVPQTWRVIKICAIGIGIAGIAIYILVIKLDAAGEKSARLEAERDKVAAVASRDAWETAAGERERNLATEKASLAACGIRTQENLAQIARLQADHKAALEAQARAHRTELKQRQSLFALKEKLNAVDQACPGPLHPADRDYVVWMCERARGRGESPAACAAGN